MVVPCKGADLIGVLEKVFPGNLGEKALHLAPPEGVSQEMQVEVCCHLFKTQSSPELLLWQWLGSEGSILIKVQNSMTLSG